MKSRGLFPLLVTLLGFLVAGPVAGATRTQTLALKVGWNAVWLEVEPLDESGSLQTVEEVFVVSDTSTFSIDQVAMQSKPAGTAEFSTDPAQLYNQAGWLVWSKTPMSGESEAITVRGNQSYLLHVSSNTGLMPGDAAGQLSVEGEVKFYRPQWTRGGYNLIGFGVVGKPTFGSLLGAGGNRFEATPAGAAVQWLNPATGHWEGKLATDAVESGLAYWISVPADLHSADYACPVAVAFTGWQLGSLDFGSGPPSVTVTNPFNSFLEMGLSPAELTFSSLEPDGGSSRTVRLSKVSDPTDEDILLFHLERVPDQLAWQTDPVVDVLESWELDSLEPGESRTVTLGLNRNWDSGGYYRKQLYRIDVQLEQADGSPGYYYYDLPVSAVNFDAEPADSAPTDGSEFAGLWVGTVTADSVTSLTEAAYPVHPTVSKSQLRVLLHVSTNGVPVLLSHVMLMQTKTADPSVEPEPVLILDEAQIPYYEGIVERGGKKVGIRYETSTFDMPRDNSVGAQAPGFLQRVADLNGITSITEVTDQMVSDYLAAQESRPTDLREAYHLSWTLEGSFGPGHMVRTPADAPLRLDAFHRTNPFRHAYHPQHGAGYDIQRSVTLDLDADYGSGSGRITGRYEERTTGLASSDLISRGTLVLRRASFVDTLVQ